MAQMHQPAALSTCPSCEEPLDTGDLFCGACGYDLSAVPAPPEDRPTLAINGLPPLPGSAPQGAPGSGSGPAPGASDTAAAGRAPGSGQWPVAPEVDSSDTPVPTHRSSDLPGTDSSGAELGDSGGAGVPGASSATGPGAPGRPAATAAEPDGYPLAAPTPGAAPAADPRTGTPTPDQSASPAPQAPSAPPAPQAPAPVAPTPSAGTKLCVACRSGHVAPDGYCENCGHAQPRERDHMEQELDAVAAVSDRGLRHHRNEDAFAISAAALPDGSPAVIAVVCDGVSSATRPDEASMAASRAADATLRAALPRGAHPQQAMHEAILAAAEAVNALADEPTGAREHSPHQNAPACTLVGAVVAGGLLVIGWVGDSRVYWVPVDRSGPAARLTEDDSWAAQMVAAGLMNEAEAYADERAHAITGWLGADAYELEPHTASFKPDRPGVVVVCTDGLWNYAEAAEEMARAVPLDAARRPLHSAQVLVGHALDGGGHDNVTVAVLPFPAPPQGAGSA
ncbi:PP2C family serine/threonine-protein phosphatase [Streptomyces flavofungini]|uniref:PP2C family serine/threonine-protein phosphatase n=1 Tax=Streptomyces flavofungini TaxID=68200 RepID=UPI0025B199B8|nr:protein phosphatase 2C domain-containing protein [Streptomyces flavofungini]WJV48641.1 protein phosphatase 2C domain-containing protein [Streptomyces flavofungini]